MKKINQPVVEKNNGKAISNFVGQSKQKVVQQKTNKTGMPDNLKSGLENLSGYDLSHVKVNFNSAKPAQLNALAYAQGNQIHLGRGQEKHLPHEGWHIVQQMQGKVNPTFQTKSGVLINDNAGLENEADIMGRKAAMQLKSVSSSHKQGCGCSGCNSVQLKESMPVNKSTSPVVQKVNRCGKCQKQLPKGVTDGSICASCKDDKKTNTNKGKGEDRNQSFGGETHEGGSKKGRTGRTSNQSHR